MATNKTFNAEQGLSVGTSATLVIDASRNVTAATVGSGAITVTAAGITQSGGNNSFTGQSSFISSDTKQILVKNDVTYVKTATGTIAQNTIVVSNNTSLTIGMLAVGTGMGTGALITNIAGTTITLSVNNSGAVSGNITFSSPAMYIGSSAEFPFMITGGGTGTSVIMNMGLDGKLGLGGTPSASELLLVNGNMRVVNNLTVDGTLITSASLNIVANTTLGTNSGNTVTVNATPTFQAAGVLNGTTWTAGGWTNLGSVTTVDINGGTLDGVTIGGSVRGAGNFTTIDTNSTTQFNDNAIFNNGKRTYWYEPGTTTWFSMHSPSVGLLNFNKQAGDATVMQLSGVGLTVTGFYTGIVTPANTVQTSLHMRDAGGTLSANWQLNTAGELALWNYESGGAGWTNSLIVSKTGTLTAKGNVVLGDATTDTVTVNGYMGIGGAGSASVGVTILNSALTSANQYGISVQPTSTSASTGLFTAIDAYPQTANAVFTCPVVSGILVRSGLKGASSTVTDWVGVKINDQTQGTNNYGIQSLVSAGANKWNIYASGTALNYFAGAVGIGMTPVGKISIANSAASGLHLSNGTTDTGGYLNSVGTAELLTSAGATYNSYSAPNYVMTAKSTSASGIQIVSDINFWSNSGLVAGNTFNPTVRMKLDTAGNVLIGTTSLTNTYGTNLNISGAASSGISFERTTATAYKFAVGVGAQYFNFFDVTAGAERMRIASTGNVLIGTTSDNAIGKLQVSGVATVSSNLYMTGGVSDESYRVVPLIGQDPYTTATAVITGALTVTLPVGMTGQMVRMTIRVYEYTTNESFEIHCGGYLYATGNSWVNNPFAYVVGNPDINRQFNVRFGYTAGGKAVVYVGETGSQWSYPQFYVSDCYVGYTASTASFVSGWVCGISTAFENVTATIAAPQVGYQSVNGDVGTLIKRGATRGNAQVTGYSTSWGVTGGVDTGGVNVVMGTGASATWLLSGTSSGTFRGGMQLLDAGTAMQLNVGGSFNYQFDNSGNIISSGGVNLYSTTTGVVNIDSGTTGAVNIGAGATAKIVTIGNITGGTGVQLISGTGAIYGVSSTALTNATADVLLIRHETTGTPAAGIGTNIAFVTETASANNETGMRLKAVTTDVTAASEDFDFVVDLMAAGAVAAERLRVTSTGNLKLNNTSVIVPASSFTYTLPVTSGNCILAAMKVAGDADVGSVKYNGATAGAGQFYAGTTLPSSGTRLNYDGYFYATYLNLESSVDTATAASHYFVENSSDGFVRPKTLANVQAEIVTTVVLGSGTANSSSYLRGDRTWAALPTTGVTITDDTTTNATRYLTFTNTTSGAMTGANVATTKLTFNPSTGDFTAGGAVTAYSDVRLKKDLIRIGGALDKIESLTGYVYRRIDTDSRETGLIAQDVQAVMPEAVRENQDGILSVAYGNLMGLMVEAIKELRAEINEMKSRG